MNIYLHFKDKDSHESGVIFFKDSSFRIALSKEYIKKHPDLTLMYAYYHVNGVRIYFEKELRKELVL